MINNYIKKEQEKQKLLIEEIKSKEKSDIKHKGNLKNIKSNLTFKKIMSNLQRNNLLNIVKYNKIFQQKLNININDYKDFCEIEIEIIPAADKYGKFINISNKEDRKYFHIYFNDNEEEIKKIYLVKNEKIKKIKLIIDYKVTSFYRLFEDCKCIESVYFKKCNRENIKDLRFMFDNCDSLKKVNFNKFKAENVTDISYFKWQCYPSFIFIYFSIVLH